MKTMLLLLLVCATLARAEELVPELKGPAQDRERDIAALEPQKTAAVAAAQAPYLAALDSADQAAMSGGKVNNVASIAREREQLQKGGMAASLPPDLPRSVDPARRTYLAAIAKIDADFTKRRTVVDGNYLQKLASLQFKALNNPTLAAQISAEKQKVATGIHGPITDAAVGMANTRWKKVGGNDNDVIFFTTDMVNNTWHYETPEHDRIRILWNPSSSTTYTLGRDGKTLMDGSKPIWDLMTPAK